MGTVSLELSKGFVGSSGARILVMKKMSPPFLSVPFSVHKRVFFV